MTNSDLDSPCKFQTEVEDHAVQNVPDLREVRSISPIAEQSVIPCREIVSLSLSRLPYHGMRKELHYGL